MKLEVVTLPVSDVDRAKRFYQSLGWRLDADIARGDAFRVVQLTPTHSPCSIAFGKGLTTGEPGSVQRLILAVSDIDAARADLVHRGVQVSEVFHLDGGRVPGPDPEGRSYQTYASFSDPDGNDWLLQEITTRLPGRIEAAATSFGSASDSATAPARSGGWRSGALTCCEARAGWPAAWSRGRPPHRGPVRSMDAQAASLLG
jgi:catechol 2,3-dioxygenase-like lactoylglutathione lyase family enzyme